MLKINNFNFSNCERFLDREIYFLKVQRVSFFLEYPVFYRYVYKYLRFKEGMKKISVVASVFISLVFLSTFVSAQRGWDTISNQATSFYDNLFEPLGKFLLGKDTGTGDLFFGKLLLFILAFSVIGLALSKFPLFEGKKGVTFVVSIITSILGVRYLSVDWLQLIVLSHSTLVVAITAMIPFVAYFFFVRALPSRTMHRIAWIFAMVVFSGLFIYASISDEGLVEGAGMWTSAYVYLFAVALCLWMFFYDGFFEKLKARVDAEKTHSLRKIRLKGELQDRYNVVWGYFNNGSMSKDEVNKLIEDIINRAEANGIAHAFKKLT